MWSAEASRLRLLDVPAAGLPLGSYSISVICEGRQVAWAAFSLGAPDDVADDLAEELAELRAGLGAGVVGDLRLDDGNSIVGTSADILVACRAAWPFLADEVFHLDDRLYRLPHEGTIRLLACASGIQDRQYVAGWHDCDDYSTALAGWLGHPQLSSGAFCRVWGKRASGDYAHSMVLAVDSRIQAWLIEPQTGKVQGARAMDRGDDLWRPWMIVG
jgi:hypothetical protein